MALSNNDIIKKLRVALQLRDSDIIEILKLVDYEISKTELSAFFRAESHPHYRQLKDQILRNFLNGLVIHKRGVMPKKNSESVKKSQNRVKDQKIGGNKELKNTPTFKYRRKES